MKIQRQSSPGETVMTWDDTFCFRCYKEIDCFNNCCKDITIFLHPLDIGRLRTELGISSTEFLEKYTDRLESQQTGIPAVVIRMQDDEQKSCPWVSENGCAVYNARPYSCRLYPLDTEQGVEYTYTVASDFCHGLLEKDEWTIETWRRDQGLNYYDDMDHELKDVMHAEQVWEDVIKDERMKNMIFMALYDPDRFREFVFNTSFLEKFKVDDDIVERIKEDDVTLLYFAAQWLRFALFGKKGFLKIDKDYLTKKKKEVLAGS